MDFADVRNVASGAQNAEAFVIHQMLKALPDHLMFLLDEEGYCIESYFPDRCQKLFGFDIQGTQFRDRIAEDDFQIFQYALKASQCLGPQSVTYRALSSSGQTHASDVIIWEKPCPGVANRSLFYAIERYVVQDSLQLSSRNRRPTVAPLPSASFFTQQQYVRDCQKEFFKLLVDDSPHQMTLITDATGRLVYVSKSSNEFLKWRVEDMVGTCLSDYVHPDDWSSVAPALQFTLSGADTCARQLARFQAKDGSSMLVTASFWSFENKLHEELGAQGTKYFVANLDDASAQIDLQRHFHEMEARFQVLSKHMQDAFAVLSTSLDFLWTAPSCERWLQYSPEQLANKSCFDLVSPEDGNLVFRPWYHEWMARGFPAYHSVNVRFRRMDGTLVWTEVFLHPVAEDAVPPTKVYAVFRDITDRKVAEHALASVEVQKKAIEASRSYVAWTTHELRNPLNGMLGCVQLLKHTSLDESQLVFVESLWASSKIMMSTLNNCLDLAKLEAGKMMLESVNFVPGQVVEEVVSVLRSLASAKGLTLAMSIAPDVPAVLRGDANRLMNVLVNLVSNSLRFTKEGSVTVQLDCEQFNSDGIGGAILRFSVRDTGCGIKQENMDKLFCTFSQIRSASPMKEHGGTGLGLFISKEIVHLLGGQIGVESVFGHGSTFWFTACLLAPLAEVGAAPAQETQIDACGPLQSCPAAGRLQAPSVARRPLRVLVAEDDALSQFVAKKRLERMGYSCQVADNGQIAVDLTLNSISEGFDVILMDMQMPVLGGLEATRILRAQGVKIPIVGLTANSLDRDRQLCLDSGMNYFLAKPVTEEKLREVLHVINCNVPAKH